jgi:AcrR family transcriptional regulator
MEREYIEIGKRRKRAYNSPEREERAQATAKVILRAAETLFGRDGYAGITMKEIAREAGVATATVYLHFPSKSAIVAALMDEITDAPDLSVEQTEAPTSAEDLVVGAARILRDLNERAWLVAGILRAHSGADPALARLDNDWRRRHSDAVSRGVAAASKAGLLRRGLAAEQATDLVYAIGGTDVFRALVLERGWTPEAYEAWLAAFMRENLLEPASQP